ncbi:hypothetical protein LINGRAHAP2_LOCUS3333 [Linum grandiflorum]
MKIETKMKQGKEIEIETEIEKLKYVLEHLKEAKRDKMEFSGQTDGEIHREMMSELYQKLSEKGSTSVAETTDDDGKPVKN